jgi:hypothetical protein
MKRLVLTYMAILVLATAALAQTAGKNAKTIPNQVKIIFNLLELPGMANEMSNWELTFELRLINQSTEFDAIRAGKLRKMQTEDRLGELVYKNSFSKKMLIRPENRKLVFDIPLDQTTQRKLLNQPVEQSNQLPSVMTSEAIKKAKEREENSQVFLLYADAIVYDAGSKTTKLVPLSRILDFRNYPELTFTIGLIVRDAGYEVVINTPNNSPLKQVTVH